jgi:hypothetical protein
MHIGIVLVTLIIGEERNTSPVFDQKTKDGIVKTISRYSPFMNK